MHRISGFLICSCFLALFFSSEALAGGGMVDENMRVTKEKETLEHEQEIVRKAESEANDEPSDEPELIQLYSQDELNGLIEKHEHLKRVKDDDCQFVRDIKDRASVLRYPSYSYLWGDMLLTATCVKQDVPNGIRYMKYSAEEGMPDAMLKLGMFYEKGTYVNQDRSLARLYLREAASLKNREARLEWARLLTDGRGSPAEMEQAYSWLFFSVYNTEEKRKDARQVLETLGSMMPPSVVKAARTHEYH